MELGWEGATTAAREEARKVAVLEMLRERRHQEAECLERLRAEERMPHEVARP
jgi:predicted nucleotidyltransferase